MRELLRSVPVLEGVPPGEIDDSAPEPLPLLRRWLVEAIEAGEPEPHAMFLATADAAGSPSCRVLICKDIDDERIYFAGHSDSRKGLDLEDNPRVALAFYWPGHSRQVRVLGTAADHGREAAEEDFQARSRSAQLIAAAQQDGELERQQGLDDAIAQVDETHPGAVPCPPTWTVYGLSPEEVEFWQGSPDRRHRRLLWTRTSEGWSKTRLWPSG